MLEVEVVRQVLAEALGRGGDLAEIFAEERSSTSLRLDDRRVEDVASGRESGAGILVRRPDGALSNIGRTAVVVDVLTLFPHSGAGTLMPAP